MNNAASDASVPLAIEVTGTGEATVVGVAGEVDLLTAVSLRDALVDAIAARPRQPVVIDAAEMGLLDAAGMTALIQAYQHAAHQHVAISLINVQPLVLRALTIVGLVTYLAATPRPAR